MLEITLIVTGDDHLREDAKISFDSNALFHKDMVALRDETEEDQGDRGLEVRPAMDRPRRQTTAGQRRGLAMATMDIIKPLRRFPPTSDVGGADEAKVMAAFKIIIMTPTKGIL